MQGLDNGVRLNAFIDVGAASHPGGVDENVIVIGVAQGNTDTVARGTGLVGDHHALLAEQRVDQRRLADVRAASHRNARDIVERLGLADLWQRREHTGHERIQTFAMRSGNSEWIAQTECEELSRRTVRFLAFGLVNRERDRFAQAPQDLCNLAVITTRAAASVHHKNNRIGLVHRLTGLRRH